MISVIIPVYRVEKYIEKCIQSMINQENKNFEVILVNDGSPDASVTIAEKLLKGTDVSFQVINTENKGVSSARNTGVRQASGEYVIFVDSDDYVSSTFIRDMIQLTEENPKSDVLFCNFIVLSNDKKMGKEYSEWDVKKFTPVEAQDINLERKIKFLLPTMLLKKEYLCQHSIYFDEGVRYSEDLQYIWKAMALTKNDIVYLNKTLYYYIFHDNSTMSTSGVEKILTGCKGILKLNQEIGTKLSPQCQKNLLPIWYFSMLHGAAKMLSFSNFKMLYIKAGCKQYIKIAAKQKSMKVNLTANLLLCNLWCGYLLMRKF